MKKLALGVLCAMLAASACGGGNGAKKDSGEGDDDDAGSGSSQACEPLAPEGSQHCDPGQKCTWVVENAAVDPPIGDLECVPSGSAALGDSCTTADTNGSGTGPDDCALGGYCIHHICEAICDTAETVAPCGSGRSCGLYTALFTGVTPETGVCDATCDQLTQNADAPLDGRTIACGGVLTCSGAGSGCGSEGPTLGCYAEIGKGVATCTGTPEGRDKTASTDDVPCTVANDCATTDGPFLNGCAPGFLAEEFDSTGSTQLDCTGMCAPLDVDSSTPAGLEGNATALGKLPTDPAPVAGHARCVPGSLARKANEACVYIWPALVAGNVANLNTNAFDDTLGFCQRPGDFTYDPTNGTGSGSDTKVPLPECSELRPGSGSDTQNGAGSARCTPTGSGSDINPFGGTEQDCFAINHDCYSFHDTFGSGGVGSGSGSGSGALRRLPPGFPKIRMIESFSIGASGKTQFRRAGGIR